MKRPTIIITVIVLVLVVGLGIYEANHHSSKTKSTSSTSTPKSAAKTTPKSFNKPGTGSGSNSFAAVSTQGLAYTATINTTAGDGSTSTATIMTDGKGTTQYATTQSAENIQITYTPTAFYTCNSGTCYKYPANQGSTTSFDPASYTYTDAQIATFKNTASYQGKKSCPAGTCDAWSVTSSGTTSTLFIDTATKRISQVETVQADGKKSSIVYDYKAVNITIPANATSIVSSPTY